MSTTTALANVFASARGSEIVRQATAEAARVREEIATERAALAEERSSLENPQTTLAYPAEWLFSAWAGTLAASGVRVSESTALQVSTVYACVDLIASVVASLDWNVYERFVSPKNKRVGRRLADDHYLFDLLQIEPNHEMSAFTYRKTLMCHALLWGNQYAEVERNGAGRPIALWPRNPAKTKPHRVMSSGLLVYETTEGIDDVQIPGKETKPDNAPRKIFAENMLHIPGLSLDARIGQSVAILAREVMGLALAAEKFGAKLFANQARPGGVLEHPGKLNDKAAQQAKETWEASLSPENAHRIALLQNGIKFTKISATAEEAQFLGTREYQKLEICGFYHVPPHMIGDSGKAGGKNNLEQIGGEFLTFGLKPWLVSMNQEYERKLLPKTGQAARKYFPGFDTKPLILPDAASRKDYYASGKQWGFLNTDDILEYEHLNPTEQEGSDLYWMPVNVGVMSATGAIIPAAQAAANAGGDPNADPGAPQADPKKKDPAPSATRIGKRLAYRFAGLFEDALRRIGVRKEADSETFKRALMPIFITIRSQLVDEGAAVFNLDITPATEESPFLIDLIEGIRKRAGQEPAGAEQIAERELPRVIRAIAIDVFRSMAIKVAKDKTEDATA